MKIILTEENQHLEARAARAKEKLSLQLTLKQRDQELEKCRADLKAERERRVDQQELALRKTGWKRGASTEEDRMKKRDRQTDRQTNREIASGPIVSVSLFMVVFWFSEWMVLWMSLAWRSPSRIYWVSSDKLRLRWHSRRTLRTIWWDGPTPRLFRSEFCTTTRNSPTLCLDRLRRK